MGELGPMAALLRRQWAAAALAPDLHTCNAALGACSRAGALDLALQLKVSDVDMLARWYSSG